MKKTLNPPSPSTGSAVASAQLRKVSRAGIQRRMQKNPALKDNSESFDAFASRSLTLAPRVL